MARTPYGNLTGRAASEQLRELDEHNYSKWVEEQKQKLIYREAVLIDRCIEIEGMKSFAAWWDDDSQVPACGPRRDRIALLEEHIESLAIHAPTVAEQSEAVTSTRP